LVIIRVDARNFSKVVTVMTADRRLSGRVIGGPQRWAHVEFTRINIEPIILHKKIEDAREAGANW